MDSPARPVYGSGDPELSVPQEHGYTATDPQIMPRAPAPPYKTMPAQFVISQKPPDTSMHMGYIFLGVLFMLSLGAAYWLYASMPGFRKSETVVPVQSEKILPRMADSESRTAGAGFTDSVSTVTRYIAYTKGSVSTSVGAYVYDTVAKKTTAYTDTVNQNHTRVQIGAWSPSGRYLPMLGYTIPPGGGVSNLAISVFDAQEKTVKKVFVPPAGTDRAEIAVWSVAFQYDSPWDGEDKIILSQSPAPDQKNWIVTYITRSGVLKSDVDTRWPDIRQKNADLDIRYDRSSTDSSRVIHSLLYKSVPQNIRPVGDIIGVVSGKLAVLVKPRWLQIMTDDSGTGYKPDLDKVASEEARLISLGYSEEEISRKLMQFIAPLGTTTLNLYDFGTGKITDTLELSQNTWHTESILPLSEGSALIAHQTDAALKPTRERYIRIDFSSSEKIRVLWENAVIADDAGSYYQLVHERGFTVSPDGSWIVFFRGIAGTGESGKNDTAIVMKNINTGAEHIICQTQCQNMSSHYPSAFE